MNREPIVVGEYYHLYNRGVDKRIVFNNKMDYERFKVLMYISNSSDNFHLSRALNDGKDFLELWDVEIEKPLISIGAWVLMPNHFHLLAREIEPGGISKFMQKLGTAYTMFFNSINDRTGALFQGRFKSKRIPTDPYLQYIYSYIHLNPLKLHDPLWKEEIQKRKKLQSEYVRFLQNFKHSSFHEYTQTEKGNERKELKILNKGDFPNYFKKEGHMADIIDWINYQ